MKTIRIMCFAIGGYYVLHSMQLLAATEMMHYMKNLVPDVATRQNPVLDIQQEIAAVNTHYWWPVAILGVVLLLAGWQLKKIYKLLPVLLIAILGIMLYWSWGYEQAVSLATSKMSDSISDNIPEAFNGFFRTIGSIGAIQAIVLLVIPVIVLLVLYFVQVNKDKKQQVNGNTGVNNVSQ